MSIRIILFAAAALLVTSPIYGQSKRQKERERAEAISHTPAADNTPSAVTVASPVNTTSAQNTVQAVASSRAKLTPAQQLYLSLNERKIELQQQADRLGAQLQTARGGKARKITKELGVIADQIAVIDRKIEAMPASAQDMTPQPIEVQRIPDELVEQRMREQGWKDEEETPVQSVESTPAVSSGVVYRVQVALTSSSNKAAFGNLSVSEVRRPDGRYAYYYGSYGNYDAAYAACKQLRAQSRYRDAFVVALQGNQRISLEEAARQLRYR